MKRCPWCINSKIMMDYHDKEWSVPLHDDKKLFEFLILEGAQAGLTWQTILNKRENYRRAFDNFDPKKISKYTQKDINILLKDAGIIRNRLKIKATIANSRKFLGIQKEFGTFDRYIWQFVNYKSIKNKFKSLNVGCKS